MLLWWLSLGDEQSLGLSENTFILLSFLYDSFAPYIILSWLSFVSQSEDLILLFLASVFEKCIICLSFLLGNLSFLSDCSLFLAFNSFTTMLVHYVSCICIFLSFISSGKFSAIFCYCFSFIFSTLSFWDSHIPLVRPQSVFHSVLRPIYLSPSFNCGI